MAGKKICALLVVVFLILNVLFVTLYHYEYNSVNVLKDEFVNEAVENLASRGVSLDKTVVMHKIPNESIYVFETSGFPEHARTTTKELAQSLDSSRSFATISFETPDGVSVGIYDSSDDEGKNELAKTLWSYEDFGIQYITAQSADVLMPDMDLRIQGNKNGVSRDVLNIATKFADGLSKTKRLGYTVTGIRTVDSGILVGIMQTAKDKEIKDMYMNILVCDSEVVAAKGKWVTYIPNEMYSNPLVDGVNVLYKLPLEELKAINSEEIVYFARRARENYYYIIPGWKVSCTVKSGTREDYYLDAVKE